MHRRRHPLARADRPLRHHHRHECLLRHRLHGRLESYFCRGVGSGELFGYFLCLLSAFVASSLLTLCGRNGLYGAAPRNQPRLPSAGANFERHQLLGLIVVSLGQPCLRLHPVHRSAVRRTARRRSARAIGPSWGWNGTTTCYLAGRSGSSVGQRMALSSVRTVPASTSGPGRCSGRVDGGRAHGWSVSPSAELSEATAATGSSREVLKPAWVNHARTFPKSTKEL